MFTIWDYVVFLGMLSVSAAIGFYYACSGDKQNTTKEFLLADRNMGALPVSLSLLASFMSAITVLGTPAEMYVYGVHYVMVWMGYVIMIPLSAYVFLPVFYNLNLTSVFEYLELRYNGALRLYVCIMYIIQTVLYMAIVLYTPALALTIVTGINVWVTVLAVGIICTIYTSVGGMKAVMWTDTFQIFVMFAGLFAIIIKGSYDFGGFGNIWKILEDTERVQFFDFDFDPRVRHTTWSLSLGATFIWLAIYGVNQAQVQRSLCCPNLKTGQLALMINMPGLIGLLIVCCMCGMVVFAQYKDCDPLTTRGIKKDQLLPLYVIENLNYPGVPGLFTASVFSGALSTISSGLNSLAAVVLQDIIKPYFSPDMSESKATQTSKLIAFGFGFVMICLTWVASNIGGVLQAALGLFGMIGGPTLGLFIMAMTNPISNSKGAIGGFTIGLVATIWVGIAGIAYAPETYKPPVGTDFCPIDNTTSQISQFVNSTIAYTIRAEDKAGYISFYRLSYLWYGLFAVVIVNVTGTIISLLTGGSGKDLDPALLTPVFDTWSWFLPKNIIKKLRCGVRERDETEKGSLEEQKNMNHDNQHLDYDTKL